MAQLILFNKPYQVMSQFSKPEDSDKQTLADYIPLPDVYPAGRLDYDSEGLLLLTDNGQLQHEIAHPNHKATKVYWVQVEGLPSAQDLDKLRKGIELKDGPTRPAQVKLIPEPTLWPRTPPVRFRANIPTTWLQIEITEGRNRQVRRMTAAIGFPTLRLVRAAVGDWGLHNLQPGEYSVIHVPDPAPKTPNKAGRPAGFGSKPSKKHGRDIKQSVSKSGGASSRKHFADNSKSGKMSRRKKT